MIEGKTIFITGGAGFIGSALAERMIERNRVIIYDDLRRNSLAQKRWLSQHRNVHLIKGDILDLPLLQASIDSANIVIHAAAVAGVDSVLRDPVQTMEVNVIGTYNLLRTCLKASHSLERVIDFSTSEVFGAYAFRATENSLKPELTVGEARWTYAISKLTGEFFANAFYIKHDLPVTCVRPFNIYGPGQVGEGAVHHFVVRAINNDDLVIYGDGGQIRAWCYIDDIIDAMLAILEQEKAIGQEFNIGNPKSALTVYNLAREIIRLSGSDSEIVYREQHSPDVEIRIPDIHKAAEVLGFTPKVEIEEGLLRTIRWYRSRQGAKQPDPTAVLAGA